MTDQKDNSTGIFKLLVGVLFFYIGAKGLYEFLSTGTTHFGGGRLDLYDSNAAALFAICFVSGIFLILSGYRRLVSKSAN
jgi:hypothetical protein